VLRTNAHLSDDETVAKMGTRHFAVVGDFALVGSFGHGVVELGEEGFVFFLAVCGGEAKGFDAFDEDFGGAGLGLEKFDGLGEIVGERHGAWVRGLVAAHEFGLDVGRGEFDDLDVG